MTSDKHALLIGVQDSPRMRKHPRPEMRRQYRLLRGCDQDVGLMRDLLVERFGFAGDPARTRVLKTREATRDAILTAVDELVDRAGSDDVVVIYYSGHGSRMRDPYDPDRRLETIVPYDTSRGPEENRDIPDLEIARWVERLNAKTPNLALIFDCCHAGSITRDPFGEAVREVMEDLRPAGEMFAGGRIPDLFAGSRALERKHRIRSGWLPEGRRAAVIAACLAVEHSWEIRLRDGIGYRFHGALTFHLARALSDLASGATWRDVGDLVKPLVSSQRAAQHPQFEGEIDQQVFGVREAVPRPYAPVTPADGEGVILGIGAVHGIEPGSLWTVRRHGARHRQDGDELARVRIEQVRSASSRGRVVAGVAGQLQAGQRAFLLQQNLPAPGLTVAVAASESSRERLAAVLARSELVAVAAESGAAGDTEATISVRCLEPRGSDAAGDLCPFLGPLAATTWAVVGRDGRIQARLRPDDDDGIEGLAGDLERLARFRGIRDLANPDPESRLHGRVELEILDRRGVAAKVDPAYGVVVIDEGDTIDLKIHNRDSGAVWVSLLELDSDHGIQVLMPRRGHPTFPGGGRRLDRGEVLRLGRDYYGVEGGLPLGLPEAFPWPAAEADRQEVGVSHLKLMVTSVPADFEFLEQEGTRFFQPAHPLPALARLYHASAGSRTLALPAEDAAKDQDWAVVSTQLGIRRRSINA